MDGGGNDGHRGVVCAGSILVDVNATIDRYPERERLALISDVVLGTGGPALNMAIDLARLGLGAPVRLAGAVGDDAHGEYVLTECARHGVDVDRVRVLPGTRTSYTDVMTEAVGGRRTFFHHIGANGLLDGEHLAVVDPTAKLFHLGAPGLLPRLEEPGPYGNGFAALLAAARAAGLRTNLELVTLEPERIRGIAAPCLPHLDYLVINELEAAALTGIEVEVPGPDADLDWAALAASADRLVAAGVQQLAVIHTPAGCVAAAPDGQGWRLGSVRVPVARVRSTVGAGDAFAAGVLYGLHEEWPVPDCLRLGMCAAAASLAGSSTSDSLRPAAQCLALGTESGFRPAG